MTLSPSQIEIYLRSDGKNPHSYCENLRCSRQYASRYVQMAKKTTIFLDSADRRILAALQRDSSLSTAALAELIGLSVSPCWRRVQRLKDEGIIQREVALLDRRRIGLNTQIFAQVRLTAQGRERIDEFAEKIRSFPEVLECYVMMGAVDFMLRIVTPDIESYEQFFFHKLSRVPGIQEISSMVALSEIKATTELPIPEDVAPGN